MSRTSLRPSQPGEPTDPTDPGEPGEPGALVPVSLQAAAGWTWRMVVVAGGIYLLLLLLSRFKVLVVPVLVALLVVALLRPLVDLMTARPGRRGLPRGVATLLAMFGVLAVLAGLFTLIGQQIATGFADLQDQSIKGWEQLQRELASGPLHVTSDQIATAVSQTTAGLKTNSNQLLTGAVQVGSLASELGTGFFIVLFSTFFFLSQGDAIWANVVRLFPRTARDKVDGAGVRAWVTLTAYVRATMIVAVVDGAGVGVVAAVLGVPLAMPLGVLVFLGAFVPVVGALVTGIVAVLVAFIAKGWFIAVLMLAGVITVQQVEAHGLQPFLMGRAVRVHPLAVILSIGAGVIVAGIVGGLFAVPLAAVVHVVAQYLTGEEPDVDSPGVSAELADEHPTEPAETAQQAAQ